MVLELISVSRHQRQTSMIFINPQFRIPFYDIATLLVPTDHPTIRAATTAVVTEDSIDIDPGTHHIRDTYAIGDQLGPSTFSCTTNINCMTGFKAVAKLNYTGMAGSSQAFITGNPRLFVSNQAGRSPIEISFAGLDFMPAAG